ncbi:hypothetical protein B0T22DRAFT_280289 [Podospora appendiculata]|uniref:Uncharacterized protein n=1 Tax=Podospora appendiculata TaxID=314037 RepID=A0AAE0X0I1_9PEZI|nr:hypothetical protein B0T22DRAFT_280289 [Podospora appendiculata]
MPSTLDYMQGKNIFSSRHKNFPNFFVWIFCRSVMAAPLHRHLARTAICGIHHQTMSRLAVPFCIAQRLGGGKKKCQPMGPTGYRGPMQTLERIRNRLADPNRPIPPRTRHALFHPVLVVGYYTTSNLVIVIAIAITRVYSLLSLLPAGHSLLLPSRSGLCSYMHGSLPGFDLLMNSTHLFDNRKF